MKKILLFLLAICGLSVNAQVPTRTDFLNVCDSLNVHHGNVVWAQARLESGNFKSVIFRSTNNCLGLYNSWKKEYFSFIDWVDCVVAYRDKVQFKCQTTDCTDDEYLDWIVEMGYAADPEYREKVVRIMNNEAEKMNKE